MTRPKAEKLRRRACLDKKLYPTIGHATGDAHLLHRTQGEVVSAHRCPFSSLAGKAHWHVGYPIGVVAMKDLAAAVRFFGEHGVDSDLNP